MQDYPEYYDQLERNVFTKYIRTNHSKHTLLYKDYKLSEWGKSILNLVYEPAKKLYMDVENIELKTLQMECVYFRLCGIRAGIETEYTKLVLNYNKRDSLIFGKEIPSEKEKCKKEIEQFLELIEQGKLTENNCNPIKDKENLQYKNAANYDSRIKGTIKISNENAILLHRLCGRSASLYYKSSNHKEISIEGYTLLKCYKEKGTNGVLNLMNVINPQYYIYPEISDLRYWTSEFTIDYKNYADVFNNLRKAELNNKGKINYVYQNIKDLAGQLGIPKTSIICYMLTEGYENDIRFMNFNFGKDYSRIEITNSGSRKLFENPQIKTLLAFYFNRPNSRNQENYKNEVFENRIWIENQPYDEKSIYNLISKIKGNFTYWDFLEMDLYVDIHNSRQVEQIIEKLLAMLPEDKKEVEEKVSVQKPKQTNDRNMAKQVINSLMGSV